MNEAWKLPLKGRRFLDIQGTGGILVSDENGRLYPEELVVEIHVSDGVAEIVRKPKGVKVILRDYDTDGEGVDILEQDGEGDWYVEQVWEVDDEEDWIPEEVATTETEDTDQTGQRQEAEGTSR